MIKFFRNIRKKLLSEGKTTNYVKYAIGEIVLVVIGILIALQINNWNEQRKYKNLEVSMLTEIRASLQESLHEINDMIQRNEKFVDNYTILLDHINNNLPYNKSLDFYFGQLEHWVSPYFNYSAFDTLKTLGAELISNDSLKKRIIRMYDRDLEFLVNDYDKSEWNYSTAVVHPFCSKNLERDIKNNNAFPNDYNKLMKTAEFKNIVTSLIVMRSDGVRRSQDLKSELKNLIEGISREIEKLN
ncbi:hypothetical protein GCM10007962_18590 [Yeosuana aromativorans]|uniref:Uncharacterized protein n=1 Tax=Yeosuana aromativorans TaxID=288019 RepID=A0A8J3BJ04_9FLAO|nr:DUF6090 family protein [Yeosuana aromativorans]GGK24641.1 hypothetical protein GCM10007962_18590 [Yeosuana aromativorans]